MVLVSFRVDCPELSEQHPFQPCSETHLLVILDFVKLSVDPDHHMCQLCSSQFKNLQFKA